MAKLRPCHPLGLLQELGLVLPVLAGVGVVVGGGWWLGIPFWQDKGGSAWLAFQVWLYGSLIVGIVLHELGHVLATRLMGGSVQGIELGGKLGRVRFRVGEIQVSVGLGLSGRVIPGPPELPPGREAFALAAGPMANVLTSPASLLLPIARPDATLIGLTLLAVGLANLAPGKLYNGRTTDGWKLVFLPERARVTARVHELVSDPDWYDRPDAFDVLMEGLLIALAEAIDSVRDLGRRPEAVQRLFRQPWTLPSRPEAALPLLVYALTLSVVSDGELPAEIADLAAERAEWAIEHVRTGSPDDDENIAEARLALAVARLRQGRPDEVEPLCADALASELDPDDRATVLATVAMARHARLLSGRQRLDEALRLAPDAAMVSEAARFLDDQDAAVTAYYRRLRRVGDGAQGEPRSAPGIP